MDAPKREVEVTIMGKPYRVVCPPEQEEQLIAAVSYLNNKVAETKSRAKDMKYQDFGGDRDSVLAIVALNASHELLKANAMISSRALKAEQLTARIKSRCDKPNADNAMQDVLGMSL